MRRVLVRKIIPAFPSKSLVASSLRSRNTAPLAALPRRFRRYRWLFGHERRLLHREMKRALVKQSCPWVLGVGCRVSGFGCRACRRPAQRSHPRRPRGPASIGHRPPAPAVRQAIRVVLGSAHRELGAGAGRYGRQQSTWRGGTCDHARALGQAPGFRNLTSSITSGVRKRGISGTACAVIQMRAPRYHCSNSRARNRTFPIR